MTDTIIDLNEWWRTRGKTDREIAAQFKQLLSDLGLTEIDVLLDRDGRDIKVHITGLLGE